MKKIIAMVAAAFVAASAFAYDISLGGRINTSIDLFDPSTGDIYESNSIFDDGEVYPAIGFGAVALVNVSDLTDAVPGLGVQLEFGFFNNNTCVKRPGKNGADDIYKRESQISLQIPILVTYKYDINDKFYVQGELGPRLSFYTNGKAGDKDGEIDNPFQFGIAVGGVVGVNITDRTAVTFGARYNRDFTKITLDQNGKTDLGSAQFIDLNAGVVFKM